MSEASRPFDADHPAFDGPQRLDRGQREHLDRLIDAVLDGAAPQDALGRADAPGEAWRELAMLRMTTDRLREPVEAPQQTEAILAAIHRRRGFLPKRVLGKISAARAAVAAGLLVALGLYAVTERMGVGTQIRGDIEPLNRLTASTQHDASRVMEALRSFNEQTSGVRHASVPGVIALERLELHPRTLSQPMGMADRSNWNDFPYAKAGTMATDDAQGLAVVEWSTMDDIELVMAEQAEMPARALLGSARVVQVRGSISAGDPFAGMDQAFAGRVMVTVSPSSGAVLQVSPGSLEAWSMMTSRQINTINRPRPIIVGSPAPDARAVEPLR